MQLDRGDTLAVELAGQLLGAVLGTGEHHGAAGGGDEVEQHLAVTVGRHVQHVVGHGRHRRLRGVGLVGDRVREVTLRDDADPGIQGGREQHPLPARGGGVEQAAHGGQEAEVGHVVGLVDDRDLDGIQGDVTLADEVLEATGAGDDDVDTLAQRRDLRVLADATEDGARGQAEGGCERGEGVLDLGRELTGRGEDEGAGATRLTRRRAARQARQQGQDERHRLARAGAATAEDVATREGVGQGRGLDGGGDGDLALGEDLDEGGGHAERAESGAGQGDSFEFRAVAQCCGRH